MIGKNSGMAAMGISDIWSPTSRHTALEERIDLYDT
jgi:hypothetical protein